MRNIALKLMYNGTAYHGWQNPDRKSEEMPQTISLWRWQSQTPVQLYKN